MNCIELLKTLVSFNSVSQKDTNETVDYCFNWLKEQELQPILLENNGYKMIVCEIGSGEKTLILNGHLDVVSGKEKQFIPYEKDGKLYGRGSADMKAGCAAMMCTLAELKDKNLPCKIQLQLVSDEEICGLNCSKFLSENGYLGDFVICGEPTQLGIGIQAKGILQLDIEVEGKSAHGSRPWQGENAIVKSFDIYNNILDLPFAKESSALYESPSINLSKVHGGNVYNKVPDKCIMSFDIRFLPTQNPDELVKQIKSVAGDKVIVQLIGSPVKTKLDDPYIKLLTNSIKTISNVENVNVFGQHGSADSRFFSKFDVPAVEFGPTGSNWHGDDEYVEIESVKQYKKMIIDFALNFNKA